MYLLQNFREFNWMKILLDISIPRIFPTSSTEFMIILPIIVTTEIEEEASFLTKVIPHPEAAIS